MEIAGHWKGRDLFNRLSRPEARRAHYVQVPTRFTMLVYVLVIILIVKL